MSGGRVRALVAAAIAIGAAAALAFATIHREPAGMPPRPASQRPALLLLTSLPLLFGEEFSLGGGSPAVERLESRYHVVPISVTSSQELANGRLLLMAHPLAQTAENLVALDAWVRRGGRVMLLADPMLEWPSKRPLGDPLRPPPMFADTGLLAHWGLRLDSPDRRGPVATSLGGFDILATSPGRLFGNCRISADRIVAECGIGNGKATVVADADFVGANEGEAPHNLDGLLAGLAMLEKK